MNLERIITGINPIKKKPIERIPFDKTQPIHAHNFPMSKFLVYYVTGFRRQGPAGIRRPYKVKKKVPTGVDITPQMFGLDQILTIDKIEQIY